MAPHRLFGHVDGAVNYSVGLWLADVSQALDETGARGVCRFSSAEPGFISRRSRKGFRAFPRCPTRCARRFARARRACRPPIFTPNSCAAIPQWRRAFARAIRSAFCGRSKFSRRREKASSLFRVPAWRRFSKSKRRLRGLPRGRARGAESAHRCALRCHARSWRVARGGSAPRAAPRPALPLMRAHGVPHLIAHLDGDISLAEAARRAKRDTGRYAKRQLTFARHQLAPFQWASPQEAETRALEACTEYFNAAKK